MDDGNKVLNIIDFVENAIMHNAGTAKFFSSFAFIDLVAFRKSRNSVKSLVDFTQNFYCKKRIFEIRKIVVNDFSEFVFCGIRDINRVF